MLIERDFKQGDEWSGGFDTDFAEGKVSQELYHRETWKGQGNAPEIVLGEVLSIRWKLPPRPAVIYVFPDNPDPVSFARPRPVIKGVLSLRYLRREFVKRVSEEGAEQDFFGYRGTVPPITLRLMKRHEDGASLCMYLQGIEIIDPDDGGVIHADKVKSGEPYSFTARRIVVWHVKL